WVFVEPNTNNSVTNIAMLFILGLSPNARAHLRGAGGLRSPARGGMIVAQGKAAAAAALGKGAHHPTSFFFGFGAPERAKPEGNKRKSFWIRNPGRRSFLACPGLLSYRPSGTSVWLAALALVANVDAQQCAAN